MRPIDADALRLMKVAECEGHTIEYAWGWKSCAEYCKNDAPIIEVKPVKHGRWIIDYAEGSKIYHAHCSECNKEPDRNIGGDYYIDKLSDFCPNCGARMDGDKYDQP